MKTIYKFLSEKSGPRGIPLKPFDLVQWATNEGSIPLTAAALLSIAEALKVIVKDLDSHVMYVATSALVMDQIFSQEIAKATSAGLDAYQAGKLRHGLQVMIGMAVNAQNWDYSSIRFYNHANANEVQAGYTFDFGSKHVSGTDDAKSGRKVAQERMKATEDKAIPSLGGIVTRRSGAIVKKDVAAFAHEIRSRQEEFTNTHARLSASFGERWQTLPDSESFRYHDGVTFRTRKPYGMFEFTDGKGGVDENYFIDFSLSADATGKGWAVHHFAGAHAERVVPAAARSVGLTLGQHQGETAVDAMTYMNASPFQGGRRI